MVHCNKMRITCQGSSRQIAEGTVDPSCSASWSVWVASHLAAGIERGPSTSKSPDLRKNSAGFTDISAVTAVTKGLTHVYFYAPSFKSHGLKQRAGADDVQEGVAVTAPRFGHAGLLEGTMCWKGQEVTFVISSGGLALTFSVLGKKELFWSQYPSLSYCVYITQC